MAIPKVANVELPGIQMLRALAALAVVGHHALEQSDAATSPFSPDWLTTAAAAGVDIFFVISGFIMLHVSFREGRPRISPLVFLFRRVIRIYPLYWLCCLAILAMSAAGYLRSHTWSAEDVLTSLLLLPSDNPLIHVSWTLVYEMYFYLVFALTLVLKSRNLTLLLTSAVIIALFAAGAAIGQSSTFLANPVPLEFCMGLWLAWGFAWFKENGHVWPASPTFALPAIALLVAASIFIEHPSTNGLEGARVLVWGLPAVVVVGAFLKVGEPRKLASRFLVLLGDASYSLYLTHIFVMIGYGWLIKNTSVRDFPQAQAVIGVIALSVGVSVVVHLLVERPIISYMSQIRRYRMKAQPSL